MKDPEINFVAGFTRSLKISNLERTDASPYLCDMQHAFLASNMG